MKSIKLLLVFFVLFTCYHSLFTVVIAQENIEDPWFVPITVSIDGFDKIVYFGTKTSASDEYDFAPIDTIAPPKLPNGFYIYLSISGIPNLTDKLSHDYRSVSKTPNDWTFHIIQTEGQSGAITWDASNFPIGSYSPGSLTIDGTDMLTQNSLNFTDDQELIIHYETPQNVILAPSNITTQIVDTNLKLSWAAVENAVSYNIYRGTEPYFTPDQSGGTNRVATGITETSWTDNGVIGDIEANYFYMICGLSSSGQEGLLSNRQGEFDYGLYSGYNFITVTLEKTYSPMNSESLGQDIPNCTQISVWDAEAQGWISHVVGLPFSNFEIKIGEVYNAYVTENGTWTIHGELPPESNSILYTGYNFVRLPLYKNYDPMNSESLGQDIPNCTQISVWDAEGQGWISHAVGLPFSNFEVKIGCGYNAWVTENGIWHYNGEGGNLAKKIENAIKTKQGTILKPGSKIKN